MVDMGLPPELTDGEGPLLVEESLDFREWELGDARWNRVLNLKGIEGKTNNPPLFAKIFSCAKKEVDRCRREAEQEEMKKFFVHMWEMRTQLSLSPSEADKKKWLAAMQNLFMMAVEKWGCSR